MMFFVVKTHKDSEYKRSTVEYVLIIIDLNMSSYFCSSDVKIRYKNSKKV